MIGASTRIKNALLTDIEVNWLDTILTIDGKPTAFYQNRNIIKNKLSKDRERSIDEVAGCRAMLLLIYANPMDFFPLKENALRALHYELMSSYKKAISYAGKYKIQLLNKIRLQKSQELYLKQLTLVQLHLLLCMNFSNGIITLCLLLPGL